MGWMQDSLSDHQSTVFFLLLFRAQHSQRALLFQPGGEHQTSCQIAYNPVWIGDIDKKPGIAQMKQCRRMCHSLIQPCFTAPTKEVSIVLGACPYRVLAFSVWNLLDTVRTSWGIRCVTLMGLRMSMIHFWGRLTRVKKHIRDQWKRLPLATLCWMR